MPNLAEYLSEFVGVCGPLPDSRSDRLVTINISAKHRLKLLTPLAVLQTLNTVRTFAFAVLFPRAPIKPAGPPN